MKNCFIAIFLWTISFSLHSQGKFIVDTSLDIQEYLYSLIDTHSVKIANVKYRGRNTSIGKFRFQNPSFEIKRGIVMSSGEVTVIGSGNKTPGTSGLAWDNDYRFRGDRDLRKLAKGKVCDQAVLEFDFIPLENEMTFNYIFASDEYKEYVGSRFNDVFGFIVIGENNFYKNIALVPGRSAAVTVNNINHLRNKKYFINNNCFENSKIKKVVDEYEPRKPFMVEVITKLFGGPTDELFTVNEDVKKTLDEGLFDNFEFDGLTKKLKAICHLTPYKVYHMKIAIGDVGDPMFDSGVFLESGSFTTKRNPKAPYFKQYADIRYSFNFDSMFNLTKAEPIVLDSPPQIEERFEITNIYFGYDSYEVHDTSNINIRELALYLKKNPSYRIHILGYTDNQGSLDYNQELSVKRAMSVRDKLLKYGIRKKRINFMGNNYSDPLADNVTEKGRSLNRRVEIVILD